MAKKSPNVIHKLAKWVSSNSTTGRKALIQFDFFPVWNPKIKNFMISNKLSIKERYFLAENIWTLQNQMKTPRILCDNVNQSGCLFP